MISDPLITSNIENETVVENPVSGDATSANPLEHLHKTQTAQNDNHYTTDVNVLYSQH